MGSSLQSIEGVVAEIMRVHKSLPRRLGIDEVEAAKDLILNVGKEEQLRVDAISKQRKGPNIPDELFFVMQEIQKKLVYFQCKEQKREAMKLLDLENVHALFDELIQRASKCIPSASNSIQVDYSNGSISTISSSFSKSSASGSVSGIESSVTSHGFYAEKETLKSSELCTRDDSYLKTAKASFYMGGIGTAPSRPHVSDSSLKPASTSGQDVEKLSLIKLASLIEVSSKKGSRDLNLQNKLMDQIEWLPDSIGKLSGLVTLDLSENRIVALPTTIGRLSSLAKLDLHSNKIARLPESTGDLFSLVCLNLRGNDLTSLPTTIGRLSCLEELNLSLNQLSELPQSIGNLVSLKKLNIETNNIEEIPHTIGQCTSLVELRAEYNRLKALPEAVGRIASLEILSVRYNNIRQLPTTMASLINLKELDVSFNELEAVPESLCLVTTLVKMNVGNNFADLQSLPRSIGNLEMLEELDISNNQIRVLPDSFGMLSRLRVLRAEENPLEVPPRHIAEKGAQAVIEYMGELVARRDIKAQPMKQKKTWTQFCFFSRPNKRKHDGLDYVKA
ncbi:plant intracellular Ras-group-related LRR protein 4-like [Macadamia integrifolia]|uniref:plant intracellular Ras-group-related LRR protein 4-like n=1 Tax=Macadamia integrifolia TaxID=60698 RepID=UPI001C50008D|nr:plant intracellular Ras-group-related LRR protein 4-like [Macadamia integrifolia]XP_042509460.1 plant intracellular Ras-group-related LRR protein 4-like [Macadamia integrifolia]